MILFLALLLSGCIADAPVTSHHSPGIGFYQGFSVTSVWNDSTNTFARTGSDSIAAQIRVITTGDELRATVSIDGTTHPFDVFLFPHFGYFIGNDKVSYAYFSSDSNTITWGTSEGDFYNVIYAKK